MELENMTLSELKDKAKEQGLKNISKLKKEEIIELLSASPEDKSSSESGYKLTNEGDEIVEGILEVLRDSGTVDNIPILVKDVLVEDMTNGLVEVSGQFRSRDIDSNGKLKVELYVYAQTITNVSANSMNVNAT